MRYPSTRLAKPMLIGALLATVSYAARERWGKSASLWFLVSLLTLWVVLWLVTRHFEKKLRDRGIEIPGQDG